MISQKESLLGTEIEIKCREQDLELATLAFAECRRIEQKYSRFLEGNELWKLNQSCGQWQSVSEELFCLLRLGEDLRVLSDCAFDLAVKTKLEAWGYGESEKGDGGAWSNVGIEFEEEGVMVKIANPVELGAIGKGYALEKMVEAFGECADFLINAGGDLYCRGRQEDGKAWRVAFEHPLDVKKAIGVVDVDDLYLASSSAAKRKWADKHHLVNMSSGELASEMLAVYTQGSSGLLADAYSTMLFVMGFEAASLALPDLPVQALLISREGKIYKSSDFCGELFLK